MSRVYLLPLSCFLLFQFTFVGTYIAAVIQGHVVPDLPYISDAATYSPESCVFGQLITVGVILLGLTVYIRYRQLVHLCEKFQCLENRIGKCNTTALWIGFISCIGISMVGNFQETNVRILHYVGACLSFGFGTIYYWYQSYMSYVLQPYTNLSKIITRFRIVLSLFCTVSTSVTVICGVISQILFEGTDPRKWYPSDGGYGYHVASSVGEWITVTIFSFYIATLAEDFRYFDIDHAPMSILVFEEVIEVQMEPPTPLSPNPEDSNFIGGTSYAVIDEET